MSKTRFSSDHISDIMLQSGWFNGRTIEVNSLKNELIANGYDWFEAVEMFLSEFGNLEIKFIEAGESEVFHFNVLKSIHDIASDWVNIDYKNKIKRKICVIGQSHRGYLTLCMASNGYVYAGFDDLLYFVAESGIKAIENLINKVDMAEI
jgi:hypothetical protein